MTTVNHLTQTHHIRGRLAAAGDWIKLHASRWRARRRVRDLLELDDRLLDDMGVTRDEVRWASYLPLSVDAVRELNRQSSLRRGGAARAASPARRRETP